MRILMVASEAEPYAKTGGLADVLGVLPRTLAAAGHEVGLVIPFYRSAKSVAPPVTFESLTIPLGPTNHFPAVRGMTDRQVQIYFIDYPAFFDREGLYGTAAGDYADNAHRYMLLSRAAVEVAKLHFRPQILHCHDWQAAMAPLLLKTAYARDPALSSVRTVFTIHNLGYHGVFDASVLPDMGLPWELFTADGIEFFGRVSFLKGGLVFADRLTTVSEGYAREIQTPEYGHGLDGLLRLRGSALTGILNGVDYTQWDPVTDRLIAANYSPARLQGKKICKRDLLQAFGLAADDLERPVIGMISRLVVQKGFDLIAAAAEALMQMDLTLVILGKGEPGIEKLLAALQQRYPHKAGLRLAHDESLAHKIEAGSDMFLMPSRYEPSGLNQMYSLKYGAVPIVRATGGLDDTVEPFDPLTGRGSGFKFAEYSPAAMLDAVQRALAAYQEPSLWMRLMRNGMERDYSWTKSASHYLRLYKDLIL